MPEHISNSLEGQEVPLTGTDAREAIREKVKSFISSSFVVNWTNPDDGGWWQENVLFVGCVNAGGKAYSNPKEVFDGLVSLAADAAIHSIFQALEQMELPEEVSRVGRETLLTHGRTLDDAFRAICAALCSPNSVVSFNATTEIGAEPSSPKTGEPE